MKALVISDTHVKRKEDFEKLEKIIEPLLEGVDVIIHAGDSVIKETVDFFKALKPTYMVRGNMDTAEMQDILPEKTVFNLGCYRIGLTHGWGQASGLKQRVFELFEQDKVNVIVFGHSHQPYVGRMGNVLMLNPGSPTDTRFTDRNTVAILEINEELRAEIIDIKP